MAAVAQLRRVLKAAVSRRKGNLVLLSFTERGRQLAAWCPDDETFTLARELILDRVYERRGIRLDERCATVIDAGAHVGIFSLQAAQWADTVVSLEPNPVNFALLQLNLERNRAVNVSPRRCALWRETTAALAFEGTHHTGGGALVGAMAADIDGATLGAVDGRTTVGADGDVGRHPPSPVAGRVATTVAAVSLDDLITELGTVDLLKIDIEGAEFETLGDTRQLAAIRNIVGEIHLDDAKDERLDVLCTTLRQQGFDVEIVGEAELYGPAGLRRLKDNRRSLDGRRMVKALAAAYLLAPVRKPIRASGDTYKLPILVATRRRTR